MDTVAKAVGIALTGALLSVFLKEKMPQFSMVISLLTGIVIFSVIALPLGKAASQMMDLLSRSGMDDALFSPILKICGIGIVTEYVANVIRDAGETAIAKKAELAAKVVIFVMILPVLEKVVDMVWSLF